MAGSRVLQFVLLISFVIFSTDALNVFLTDGKGIRGFKYETRINYHMENATSVFDGCDSNDTYTAGPTTTKVIVYIRNYFKLRKRTLRIMCGAKRVAISETLSARHYEMLYLGVSHFRRNEQHLIAEFLHRSIKSNRPHFQINTIGEKISNLTYHTVLYEFDKYEEEPNVFGGDLLGELRSLDE